MKCPASVRLQPQPVLYSNENGMRLSPCCDAIARVAALLKTGCSPLDGPFFGKLPIGWHVIYIEIYCSENGNRAFFHIVMNVLMREQSERDCKSPPDKIVSDTFSRSTKTKKRNSGSTSL